MKTRTNLANILLWGVLLLTLIFIGSKVFIQALPSSSAIKAPVTFGEVPPFRLTDSQNQVFDSSSLKGKVWIADFIFTRCAGPCPLITGKMKQLQETFKEWPGARLISFSVDPEYDTPAVLSEYAKKYQADLSRWSFLTGPKEEIYSIIQKSFHLGVETIPEENRGAADQSVSHSTKFVLVDARGTIRGYYDSQTPEQMDALVQNAQALIGGR